MSRPQPARRRPPPNRVLPRRLRLLRTGVLLTAVVVATSVVINLANGSPAEIRTAALAIPPLPPTPAPTPTPTPSPAASSSASSANRPAYDAGALDPLLEKAFEQAQTAAKTQRVSVSIRTGYRSAARQQALFEAEIARTGSRTAALERVLPAQSSEHVRGGAIDVKPEAGAAWLEENGAEWGLCRRYANEWWHFELLTEPGGKCPTMEPQPQE